MKNYKSLIVALLLTAYCLLPTDIGAYYEFKDARADRTSRTSTWGTMGEVTDKPADFWWIFWTGAGDFADYTVSNTLQGGVFGRPQCGDYFDATFEQAICASAGNSDALRGLSGEYPAGSRQYYVWAAGPWIGALYPAKMKAVIDTITGDTTRIDTTWQRRVSKGAYYSDMGGMALPELESAGEVGNVGYTGLAFSTQIIPYNHGYEHEGEQIFRQPGMSMQSYQALWPFVDTLVNLRREDTTTYVHPELGDILSDEDTYAVAGDWIPEKDASCIWVTDAGRYDIHPLGIRVEQRTYSWNYDYNNAYIYLNWKIRNMNPFPLDSVYVGYFMDNDVGHGMTGAQGCEDDLIGFDTSYVEVLPGKTRKLDLGYTYDSDGYEPNWTAPAGFVGCVLCETPLDKGLTGFQYWTRVGEFGQLIDELAQDSLKYEALAYRQPRFIVAGTPDDMRQLSCSGPYARLQAGEEIEFTVAIVVGWTFDELKERAIAALTQFELGYLGYAPPPSPKLSVVPGDGKVYLSWDGSLSENYIDKMANRPTFEGYKVYRSMTGLPQEWDTLAVFDLKSSTSDAVLVKYTKGTSKAEISFEDVDTIHSWIKTRKYKLVFVTGHEFDLWDITNDEKCFYNSAAPTYGEGYCVMDTKYGTPYPENPGYVSGAFIYIPGFYIKIENGKVLPDQPGVSLAPCSGDEFVIWTYGAEDIGKETGIEHYYVDEDTGLKNGMKYYYTVTAFSRPLPELDVGSLESGKSGTQYWAIPMKLAVDFEGARDTVLLVEGVGDIDLKVTIGDPTAVIGDTYRIYFFTTDTVDTLTPKYWRLIKENTQETVLDSCSYFNFETTPLIDGLDIKLAPVVTVASLDTETVIDSDITGWSEGSSNWKFTINLNTGKNRYPYYDYEFVVSDTGSVDIRGTHAPFTIWNTDLDTRAIFWYKDKSPYDTLSHDDKIYIYNSIDDTTANYYIRLTVDTNSIPPEVGDVYKIKIFNQLTTQEVFEIATTKYNKKREKYSLDSIRVVPNPYYIRAPWDASKFQQKIWFQGLPSKCTIRIFNIAGLLIKTIEHEEPEIPDMDARKKIGGDMSGTGAHAWDLCSEEKKGVTGLKIASGLYIYQIATPDGSQKVGKFAVIR